MGAMFGFTNVMAVLGLVYLEASVVLGSSVDTKVSPSLETKGYLTPRDESMNPCENRLFQKPVLDLNDFKFRKQYVSYVAGAANFTLTDIANNYTIACGSQNLTGSSDFITPDDYDFHNCDTNDIVSSPDKAHLNFRYRYLQNFNVLSVIQEWICSEPNRSYPRTYIAQAEWNFTSPLDCPNDPKQRPAYGEPAGPIVNCTLSRGEKTPPTRIVSWQAPTPAATKLPIQPNNASVASTENPPLPSNERPCIGRSFTYPGWYVDDFARDTSMREHRLSFTLRHKATNYTMKCATNGDFGITFVCNQGDWARFGLSKAPETRIELDAQTRELTISQVWDCAEQVVRSPSQTFKATGHVIIPLECTTDTGCPSRSFAVQGTLSKPISLTPTGPPPPPGIKTPKCTSLSASASWTISNIKQWQERTAIYSAFVSFITRKGTLDFDLHNHANDVTTHCRIEGEQLTNYTGWDQQYSNFDTWWSCDAIDLHLFPKYNISTSVQFNKKTGFLGLNQTWYCSDEGDDHPTSFNAQGQIPALPLKCTDTSNPSSPFQPQFQHRTENCTVESPQLINSNSNSSRTDLAAGELDSPALFGRSCTIDSVRSTSWDLRDWSLYVTWETYWIIPHYVEAQFTLRNNGFGKNVGMGISEVVQATPYVYGSDPAFWYPCRRYPVAYDPDPLGYIYCFYQLDLATGYFAVNQSWYCDDKDAEHPVVFEATGSKLLDLECGYRPKDYADMHDYGGWQNRIGCNYTSPGPFKPTKLTRKTLPGRVG